MELLMEVVDLRHLSLIFNFTGSIIVTSNLSALPKITNNVASLIDPFSIKNIILVIHNHIIRLLFT